MTTAVRAGVSEQEHAAMHGLCGVCMLCSDQVSWWREARIKAGYSEEPPYPRPRKPAPAPEPAAIEKPDWWDDEKGRGKQIMVSVPRTYHQPRFRYCCVCGEQLEPKQPYEVLSRGQRDKYTSRMWFCDDHGQQIRRAIRQIVGSEA